MSLESKIVLLIAAIEANTQAIAGNVSTNVPTTGVAPLPTTPTVVATPPTQAPAPSAPAAPVAPVVAPVIQPVVAPPVVASLSNLSVAQLQQEVTSIYQNATPEVQAQIGLIIQAYGAISAVPVDQTGAVLAQVKAL